MAQKAILVEVSAQPEGEHPADYQAFPTDWNRTTLGEVGVISGGGTPSTQVPAYWDGELPWLTPSEVTRRESLFISDTERRITESGLASSVAKLLPPGTVMMTSRATIGEVVINKVPMATNQGFINVVCDSTRIHNEFLAYWILRNKQVFADRAHGVTFKEITKSNFKTIPIVLPSLPEQLAIACALRAVQVAVQTRRRELELERERKATLMQHLFTHGTRGEPTKATEIGEMPESWQAVQLADLVTRHDGIKRGPWGGSIKKEIFVPSGYKVYEQQNAIHNDFSRGRYFIDENKYRELHDFAVCPGDVLISAAGTIGKLAVVPSNAAPGIINQALLRVRLDAERISTDYFKYLFSLYVDSLVLESVSHGAAMKNLSSISVLRSLALALPALDEQREIATVLTACDETLDALDSEVALLDELFRALLEELMTGRLSAVPLVEAQVGVPA